MKRERDDLLRIRWTLSRAGFKGASETLSGFRVTRNGDFCEIFWHTGDDIAPAQVDEVRADMMGQYRALLAARGFEATGKGLLLVRSPRSPMAGGYRVGERITYRTRDGFWEHGAIVDSDGESVTLLIDRKQVSPGPKIQGMPNDPGPMRDVEPPQERVVDVADKRLSASKERSE